MHNFARNAGRFSPEQVLTLWTWPGISGHVMIVSSFPLISLISFHFYLAGNPCRCDSAGSVVGQILLDAMAKNAMMGPYSTWYTLAHRIADTIYLVIYLFIYIYIYLYTTASHCKFVAFQLIFHPRPSENIDGHSAGSNA